MQHSSLSGVEGCAPARRVWGDAVAGLPAEAADMQKGFPKCPVKYLSLLWLELQFSTFLSPKVCLMMKQGKLSFTSTYTKGRVHASTCSFTLD